MWMRATLLMVALASPSLAEGADWRPVEKTETYAIHGKSGAELYSSIGEKGPQIGGAVRSLAHTTFTLTWTRKYEPQADGSCLLAVARPKLTIVYTLPRPAGRLPPAVRESWATFIAGVEEHERVHGAIIREMVDDIETMSVGLSVPDDRGCRKIRTVLTERLAELSLLQRQRSRDFDRIEMADGGRVHQLVLALVNGP